VLKVCKFKILSLLNWLAYTLAYINKQRCSIFGPDIQLFIIHWSIETQFKTWIFETVFFFFLLSLFCLNRLTSPLSKYETRRDSSLALMICPHTVIKTVFMYFCV